MSPNIVQIITSKQAILCDLYLYSPKQNSKYKVMHPNFVDKSIFYKEDSQISFLFICNRMIISIINFINSVIQQHKGPTPNYLHLSYTVDSTKTFHHSCSVGIGFTAYVEGGSVNVRHGSIIELSFPIAQSELKRLKISATFHLYLAMSRYE